ncbi:MAG: nucleotidyltransferase domain-containing protein [Candidatus Cryptobacteroides sp.]
MNTNNEILSQIVSVGKRNIPQGGRLLLYGSQARGTATPISDWDLLIILDKPNIEQSDYDNVSFPFTMLGWNIGRVINPILYTKDEWARYSFTPFYKNVLNDAIYLI